MRHTRCMRTSAGLLGPLELGEARQQPLDPFAGEGDRHFLVVLDQLRADDDAVAEQRVAHLLAGEEAGIAGGLGPRRAALRRERGRLRLARRYRAPRSRAIVAGAAVGEHTSL